MRRATWVPGLILLAGWALSIAPAAEPRILRVWDEKVGSVLARGLPAKDMEAAAAKADKDGAIRPEDAGFRVWVKGQADAPLLGTCRVESGTLHFRPRFPFTPGLTYEAKVTHS